MKFKQEQGTITFKNIHTDNVENVVNPLVYRYNDKALIIKLSKYEYYTIIDGYCIKKTIGASIKDLEKLLNNKEPLAYSKKVDKVLKSYKGV